jgi:hypothetical protein
MVDELKEIPERYAGQNIDLMLVHLGGTTIPSPHVPLLMVTMDAKQGLELVRLIGPDMTIPIHFDDYPQGNRRTTILDIHVFLLLLILATVAMDIII